MLRAESEEEGVLTALHQYGAATVCNWIAEDMEQAARERPHACANIQQLLRNAGRLRDVALLIAKGNLS